MKFEYKVVGLGLFRADHEAALNREGADDWDLVAVSGNYAYLKKQVRVQLAIPALNQKPVPQSTPKGGEATAPPASAEPIPPKGGDGVPANPPAAREEVGRRAKKPYASNAGTL